MAEHDGVVAGYDGSAESEAAVRWAAAVAHRRGVSLRVVTATGVNPSSPAAYRVGVDFGAHRARRMAEDGVQIAREAAPAQVEAMGIEQGAVSALVEQSAAAQLIVLGHRGRGRLRGALLGSSAFSVAMHAHCPVAVVRGALRPLPSPEFPIVAAVDGSRGSLAAAKEAARLAAETGATLKIVVAYASSSSSPWLVAKHAGGATVGGEANVWAQQMEEPAREGNARRREAARIAEEAAGAVGKEYPDVPVELVVIAGRPERAVVEAAEDASLIVMGARGRGDFASLLLGSVSRDVIQHADCAVYIVR